MKTITKPTTKYKTYKEDTTFHVTSDGKEWLDLKEAEKHQTELDRIQKETYILNKLKESVNYKKVETRLILDDNIDHYSTIFTFESTDQTPDDWAKTISNLGGDRPYADEYKGNGRYIIFFDDSDQSDHQTTYQCIYLLKDYLGRAKVEFDNLNKI